MVLRVPKRKKRSSPDDQPENKVAKQFRDSAGKQTGEASSSSQSNTPHPAAQTPRQQKLVAEIRRFGRKPKCNPGKSPDDKYEYNLYMKCYRNKEWLPQDLFSLPDQSSSSSQSNAPHPAAPTKAQQKVVEGRLSKQNLGDSAGDSAGSQRRSLRKTWSKTVKRIIRKKSCKTTIWNTFRKTVTKPLPQADEVPDTKASSSSQSNAAHPVALTKKKQKVVDDIKNFGRLPKKNTGDSEEDKWEYKLYWRYYNHKKDLPESILQHLLLLQEKADARQKLMHEIKKFGRWPLACTKTCSSSSSSSTL